MRDPLSPAPAAEPLSDSAQTRFTHGFVSEVFAVLERHGFTPPAGPAGNQARGRAVWVLGELTRAFEGRRDAYDDDWRPAEDREDAVEAEAAMSEPGESIPLEELEAEFGIFPPHRCPR